MDTVVSVLLLIGFLLLVGLLIHYGTWSAKDIGAVEEKRVRARLQRLGSEYHTFNDVLIHNSYGTTQMDHIVVSPYGVFVIETKNYQGWIMGGENSEKWTQNIWGHKYELNNPIRQNYGHIEALKQCLPRYHEAQYISIIVFSPQAELKVIVREASNVIYHNKLLACISSYKERILSDDQVMEYCAALTALQGNGASSEKEHIASVRQKEYRSRSMVRSGICPRCGGTLVERSGKYGKFYGCSNYPNCKFTLKA